MRSPGPPPVVSRRCRLQATASRSALWSPTEARLYFSENLSGHSVLRQVSTSGGETAPVPISLVSADIYDFYPGRSELLVKGVAEGSETEWPVWILPLPAGSLRPVGDILAHGATWAPDGQRIVYVRKSSVYTCNAGWNRFARTGHRAGSSFCAAIFSRWPPLAFHHTGHQPAHFFAVGGFGRRQRVCIQCCRTGTSRRRNLAEPGRRMENTSFLNRRAITPRTSGPGANAHLFLARRAPSRRS